MAKSYPWPLGQMQQWYESGMTLDEISAALSSEEWMPYWQAHLGREYRPGQKIVNKVLKRSGLHLRNTGAVGTRNGSWNGGRVIDKDGYVLIRLPSHPNATYSGYVREHRLVMEKQLGRSLRPTEVVHHKDNDKQNNHPNNLELFQDNSKHVSKTMKGRVPSSQIHVARQRRIEMQRARMRILSLAAQSMMADGLRAYQIAGLLKLNIHTISKYAKNSGWKFPQNPWNRPRILTRHRQQAQKALASLAELKPGDPSCTEKTDRPKV